VIAHFGSTHVVPLVIEGEIVQGAKEQSAVLVLGELVRDRFIEVVSPRAFTFAQLVGMA
jgi:hypothetical protein